MQRYPSGFRFPGGESFTEMQTRITGTVDRARAPRTAASASSRCPTPTRSRRRWPHALGTHLDLFQRIVDVAVLGDRHRCTAPAARSVLTVNSTGATSPTLVAVVSESFDLADARPSSPPAPSVRPASASSTSRRAGATSVVDLEAREAAGRARSAEYLAAACSPTCPTPTPAPDAAPRARRAGRGRVGRRLARRRLRRRPTTASCSWPRSCVADRRGGRRRRPSRRPTAHGACPAHPRRRSLAFVAPRQRARRGRPAALPLVRTAARPRRPRLPATN